MKNENPGMGSVVTCITGIILRSEPFLQLEYSAVYLNIHQRRSNVKVFVFNALVAAFLSSVPFHLSDLFGHRRQDLKYVPDDAVIGHFEYRCFGIAVDRDDIL